jgi:hypothetical protein
MSGVAFIFSSENERHFLPLVCEGRIMPRCFCKRNTIFVLQKTIQHFTSTRSQTTKGQTMPTIQELAATWLQAKADETAANARRLETEEEILKLLPAKEEGKTTTPISNTTRISTTGKITFKSDIAALQALTMSWPEAMRPLKTKIEQDEPVLRQIRTERPDLWRHIATAITVKPAKVYIQIEVSDGV